VDEFPVPLTILQLREKAKAEKAKAVQRAAQKKKQEEAEARKEEEEFRAKNPYRIALIPIVDTLIETQTDPPSVLPSGEVLPKFHWFKDPVKTTVHKDYRQFVSRPMELSKVRRKAAKGDYTSFDEFKADIQLIRDNCYAYNEPKPDNRFLLPIADALMEKLEELSVKFKEGLDACASKMAKLLKKREKKAGKKRKAEEEEGSVSNRSKVPRVEPDAGPVSNAPEVTPAVPLEENRTEAAGDDAVAMQEDDTGAEGGGADPPVVSEAPQG